MIREETIKLFDTYSSYFIVFILPGLAAMDYAFERGLFSGGINNIYEFFLLIFWSISLSVPFLVIVIIALRPHELHEKEDPYGQSFTSTANAAVLYVGLLTLTNYAVFNACEYYLTEYLDRLVILNVRVSLLIVAGIGTYVLAYPLAIIYRGWVRIIRGRGPNEN